MSVSLEDQLNIALFQVKTLREENDNLKTKVRLFAVSGLAFSFLFLSSFIGNLIMLSK